MQSNNANNRLIKQMSQSCRMPRAKITLELQWLTKIESQRVYSFYKRVTNLFFLPKKFS